jgi:hypothetical protein
MHETLINTEKFMQEVVRKGGLQIDVNKQKIRVLTRKKDKYVYKGKGVDFLGLQLAERIKNLENENKNLEMEIGLVNEAILLLKDYEALDLSEIWGGYNQASPNQVREFPQGYGNNMSAREAYINGSFRNPFNKRGP